MLSTVIRHPRARLTLLVTLVIAFHPAIGSSEQLATPRATPTPAPARAQCGDLSGDADVTVTDGVGVLRAVAGLSTSCAPYTCDADGDGALTVTDGVRVLRAAADLGIFSLACPPLAVTEDFSGFTRFEFRRQPALGFCPPEHSVMGATIERDGQAYRVTLSILEVGTVGDPDCLFPGDPCFTERFLPTRDLSAPEVDTVRATFAATRVTRSPLPICVRGSHFDPCRIDSATWDDVHFDDYGCHTPRLDGDQMDDISTLLDSLH